MSKVLMVLISRTFVHVKIVVQFLIFYLKPIIIHLYLWNPLHNIFVKFIILCNLSFMLNLQWACGMSRCQKWPSVRSQWRVQAVNRATLIHYWTAVQTKTLREDRVCSSVSAPRLALLYQLTLGSSWLPQKTSVDIGSKMALVPMERVVCKYS